MFQLTTEIVAVEGDTAVSRQEVRYGDPVDQEYRDLWVMRFADDGRCRSFEEWPFWPGQQPTDGDAQPPGQRTRELGRHCDDVDRVRPERPGNSRRPAEWPGRRGTGRRTDGCTRSVGNWRDPSPRR
ncbi:hypothetical protein NKG94_04515 [Micromonospora sp. M12]